MALIYRPKQRKADLRWDMTCEGDEGDVSAHAVGYCAGWVELAPAFVDPALLELWKRDREERRLFRARYHEDGHATGPEALECWREHQLDLNLRFEVDLEALKKCAACGNFTHGRVVIAGPHGGEHAVLCSEHRTRSLVKAALWPERGP